MKGLDPSSSPGRLEAMLQRYNGDERARAALLEDARSRVQRWRWASENMLIEPLSPFYRETSGARPRWLKEGARLSRHSQICGLATGDEITFVLDPWFNDKQDLGLATETAVLRDGPLWTRIRLDAGSARSWLKEGVLPSKVASEAELRSGRRGDIPAPVASIAQGTFADRRLIEAAHYWRGHGARHETFEWDGDRLVRSVMRMWDRIQGLRRIGIEFTYDDAGHLDRIWKTEQDWDTGAATHPPRLDYRRPREGETMPVIAGQVERLLCEGVAAAVASVRPLSAVYCMILSYTDEAFLDAWPPFLVLGTEAYRERMRHEHPDELPYYLWAPDEMRGAAENIELELSDPGLLEKCGIHCELMKVRNSDASGRKVVRDAALELAKRDWATQMPISDDFVVVAVDNSGGVDPIKDMKKVLAPAAFQKLKKRGWA